MPPPRERGNNAGSQKRTVTRCDEQNGVTRMLHRRCNVHEAAPRASQLRVIAEREKMWEHRVLYFALAYNVRRSPRG